MALTGKTILGQLVGCCDEQHLQCVNSSESELRALISSPPFRQVTKFPGNLTILGSLLPTWEGVFPHVE